MIRYSRIALLGAVVAAILLPQAAPAQWNNAPYQPKLRGIAGGIGISPGYKQVIISRELGNRQEKNFYRSASGDLLDVAREGRNVFVISPDGFPTSRDRLARTGFGYGFSTLGRGSYASPLGVSSNAVISGWIGMVQESASYRVASISTSITPIDSWIGQLSDFD